MHALCFPVFIHSHVVAPVRLVDRDVSLEQDQFSFIECFKPF